MIEQILAFVLGVGSVPLIWGVVLAFRTARKLKTVQEELPNIYSRIDEMNELINRRIDGEIDRVDKLVDGCLRHTDSRVDKLESKNESKFDDILQRDAELRQRINNTAELVNDIAGLNISKK